MRFLPNILTVLRIILTPFFVFCLLQEEWQAWGIVIFVVASLTDWYDGYLARKYRYNSDWGTFLDPLADKILILSAFFSFVYLGLIKLWMVMIIVGRDFVVTGLRSYALSVGKPMSTNVVAKLKTATQMTMIAVILTFLALQSVHTQTAHFREQIVKTVVTFESFHVIYTGMLVVTILTAFSGVYYLYQNRNVLRHLGALIAFKD
jgi:CDP-diacylglycerol--glycerol-3-phosphate 3-phosphatidyltransferase